MNNCFKIFHADNTEIARTLSYENEYKKFSERYRELDTPTIYISSKEEYLERVPQGITFDPNGYDLDNFRGWRWGELGIWSSNFLAWKNFLRSDYDHCILVEDDIMTSVEFFDILESQLESLPQNWDAYHAFVPADQYNKYSHSLEITDTISRVYQDWSMLCYVVSRAGAEKLLNLMYYSDIQLPLDWFFFRQDYLFQQYTHPPGFLSRCTLLNLDSTFQLTQERRPIE